MKKKVSHFSCLLQAINEELEKRNINADDVVSISAMNDGGFSTKVIIFYKELIEF